MTTITKYIAPFFIFIALTFIAINIIYPRIQKSLQGSFYEFYLLEGEFDVIGINITRGFTTIVLSDGNKYYFRSTESSKVQNIKKGDGFEKNSGGLHFTIHKGKEQSFLVNYVAPIKVKDSN